MKVLTFSRAYPSYHPKKGQPTYFVEKILNSLSIEYKGENDVRLISLNTAALDANKYSTEVMRNFNNSLVENIGKKDHTIRAGKKWKEGDWFAPKVWGDDVNLKTGRAGPYQSKQIQFAPPVQIKKIWDFEMDGYKILLNGNLFYHQHVSIWHSHVEELAQNDGLTTGDLYAWFKMPAKFRGQILCWNENTNY